MAFVSTASQSRSSGGGTQVAYAEITSNASITATTAGTANTIVTAPAFTADGLTRYIANFFSPVIVTPASNVVMVIGLYVDGTFWGRFGFFNVTGTTLTEGFAGAVALIPASGSRVLSARAWVASGTGTVQAGAGNGAGVDTNSPAYLRIIPA